jgi:hypothetical protein
MRGEAYCRRGSVTVFAEALTKAEANAVKKNEFKVGLILRSVNRSPARVNQQCLH